MRRDQSPPDVHRTSTGRPQEVPTQTETETETKYKTTSSLSDAQTRGRAIEQATTARIRSIHPVDALTVTLIEIRPDWKPEQVHATILRDRRAWTSVVAAALECALDPDVRSPFAIENHGARSRTETVPVLPTVAEALAPQLCAHEFRVGACPFCRRSE